MNIPARKNGKVPETKASRHSKTIAHQSKENKGPIKYGVCECIWKEKREPDQSLISMLTHLALICKQVRSTHF